MRKQGEEKENGRSFGYLISVTSAVIFGLMPLLTKTVYQSGANSYTAAFMRMLVGTAVFLLLHRLTEKTALSVNKKELKQLLIFAIGYGTTPILLYTSYNYLASGLATTLHFVYPVLVVAGSVLCGLAKLTRRKVICCILCMAGIIAFYTPGGEVSLKGILIALASGVMCAFYTIYLEASDLLRMEPYKLAFWNHGFGMLIIGVCALLLRKFCWPGTAGGWTFALLLGLATAAASFLYQQSEKYIGAQDTALLATFEPLTSIIIGYFVYAEPLTGRNIAGIICILLSVILLSTEKAATSHTNEA